MDLKNKKLFVFDLDGTVYLGGHEIDGSYAAIDTLREAGKKVCFFTNNSSRMHLDYVEYLTSLGLKTSEDEIYTSGQVAAEYILKNFPNAKVFLLGNDRLRAEFSSYGISLDDDNPTLTVLGFDTSLTYDRLYTFCKFLKRGLPYISTHPDVVLNSVKDLLKLI